MSVQDAPKLKPSGAKLQRTHLTAGNVLTQPRERLMQLGVEHLADTELLALLLGTGTSGECNLVLAQKLIDHFGSIDGVMNQPPQQLLAHRGLGVAKVTRLKAAYQLGLRCSEEKLKKAPAFSNAGQVMRYLQRKLGQEKREIFGGLYLDTRHHLISWEALFYGSINKTHVHGRVVLQKGVELNAAAVILAHNHPSGVAEPSRADIALTKELSDLCQRVDIQVLDHIVVAQHEVTSLSARGFLP